MDAFSALLQEDRRFGHRPCLSRFWGLRNAGRPWFPSPRSVGGARQPPCALRCCWRWWGTVLTVCLGGAARTPGALVLFNRRGDRCRSFFCPGSTPGHAPYRRGPQHLFSAPYSYGAGRAEAGPSPTRCTTPCNACRSFLALLFTDLFFRPWPCFSAWGARAGLMDTEGKPAEPARCSVGRCRGRFRRGAVGARRRAIIYLESAAGVEAGGRTGLVSVSTAACFFAGSVRHSAHRGGAGSRDELGVDHGRHLHDAGASPRWDLRDVLTASGGRSLRC